jgi:hypothetical protein
VDPFTIAVAITFFGGIAVALIVITIKRIVQWFKARGQIKAENARRIAFTLAERISNKQYVEVPGVFDNNHESTRMIQGFYDPDTDEIVDARALVSNSRPDQVVIDQHDEGDGLVVYT